MDYYGIISHAVQTSSENPYQARQAIYDLARMSLHREVVAQYPPIEEAELQRHSLALENAIEKVEAEYRTESAPHLRSLWTRVDIVIQSVCAAILLITILAVATGYIEIRALQVHG